MEPDVKALTAIAKEISELRKAVERLTKTLCALLGEETEPDEEEEG